QRHAFFQYDEVLGWTHTPNKIAFFKNARVEINARGLRDDEVPYQKPAGEFRILFLGDSQLFGDGVSSEETFTSLLEAEFNDVQAINAGIIGYGTDQQLLFLKKEGMKYSPGLIVVALNAYDFQDNVSKTIRSGYAKPLFKIEGDELRLTNVPVPKFDIIERMNRRFRNMSHLYYFTSMGLGRTVNRGSGGTRQRYDPGSILLKAAQLENAVRVTKKILKEIAQVGQNVNAKTVVVFLPYEMDFGSDSNYKNQINQISQKLDTYSRENDFLFLDIRADLAASSHTNIYLDSMHFNSVGHKIVAEVLAENLMKFNLIPKVHIK
ncbi:MAG: hypothetical protein O7C75_06680, partial [Verrucomicrobia bacterium]|nr:hypothetical protein [Verrucomicrobiota bacterium]